MKCSATFGNIPVLPNFWGPNELTSGCFTSGSMLSKYCKRSSIFIKSISDVSFTSVFIHLLFCHRTIQFTIVYECIFFATQLNPFLFTCCCMWGYFRWIFPIIRIYLWSRSRDPVIPPDVRPVYFHISHFPPRLVDLFWKMCKLTGLSFCSLIFALFMASNVALVKYELY